jgi:hypothetical protein
MIKNNLFFPKQNQYTAADVDLAEGQLRHLEAKINKAKSLKFRVETRRSTIFRNVV